MGVSGARTIQDGAAGIERRHARGRGQHASLPQQRHATGRLTTTPLPVHGLSSLSRHRGGRGGARLAALQDQSTPILTRYQTV